MYQQVLDPVGHSLAWSAAVAALPLLLLFILLGVLKMTAWVASLISLAVSVVIAVAVYGMPIGQTLLAGSEGAAFGFFPILWIVINAIWVYQMTVETGHFDVLRRSFTQVSDDQRIQAIIIAFSFGALIEALAGFGTPVAVTSVMLMALGFTPLKAAVIALTANTAPVAFGAMATPIITLGKVTELPVDTLGALFGALQVTAAHQAGLSDVLMAASNSSGGVLGKMISPQNLAIAAAAVGLDGREGDIFRRVILWSVGFLVLLCLISGLQATPVLGWMVP